MKVFPLHHKIEGRGREGRKGEGGREGKGREGGRDRKR